jgi:hypothetical protein
VQQIRTLLPVTCKLFAALGDVAQFVKYLEWDHVNAKAWGTITYLLVLHVLAWPGKAMRTGFDLCLLRPNNTDFIVDLLRPEFPVSPSFVASLVSYGRTYLPDPYIWGRARARWGSLLEQRLHRHDPDRNSRDQKTRARLK